MAERYISLFELGSGAFGQAFVVKDKVTDAKYVTKVMQVNNYHNTNKLTSGVPVAVLFVFKKQLALQLKCHDFI